MYRYQANNDYQPNFRPKKSVMSSGLEDVNYLNQEINNYVLFSDHNILIKNKKQPYHGRRCRHE